MKKFLRTLCEDHFNGYVAIDKIDRFYITINHQIYCCIGNDKHAISSHTSFKAAELALHELVAWLEEETEPKVWE